MLTPPQASRLAAIALGHVTREYPNKLDHVLGDASDLAAPRALHPIFYGSLDWHSCVHGHWLLAHLLRRDPRLPEADRIRALLTASFTAERVAGERAYLARPTTRGFERPYGWAWLLMLAAELARFPVAERDWFAALQPLAATFAQRFMDHLPRATYPVRTGVHSNTAFALTLALEYAATCEDAALAAVVRATARRWYWNDAGCQAWEPGGEDFLSPALIEAVCMRQVLAPGEFALWFRRFLPDLEQGAPAALFEPAIVTDRSDGRIVHLDGLNLSRAWCWASLATALAPDDPLRDRLWRAARRHIDAGLPHVTGDYMGEHWLATFACLALEAVAQA
jgi:hypothetical protein